MDQKVLSVIKEYVAGLKDDEARNLQMRLDQRFSRDLEEVLLFIQQNAAMDEILKSANNYKEFDLMLEAIHKQLDFEQKIKH
jgi:hypothetical protein